MNRISDRLADVLSVITVIAVLSVFSAPAHAQNDPRLVEAIRQAQEGGGDSARTRVRLLLAATSPTDTLYPEIIYTQAMVASDANEMRRQLQRVAIEYPSSSWADDALLRLVQLDYASGNLEGAARNLERIRSDYPGSALLPQASYWAARTYFDQKSPGMACRWIADGLGRARGNVELENQLRYLDQRCSGFRTEEARRGGDSTAAPSGVSTVPSTSPTRVDTVKLGPPSPVQPTPSEPAPATPQAAVPAPSPLDSPPAAVTTAAPPGGRFRIQVTAVRTPVTAEALAAKLRRQGFAPVIFQEAGLYKVRIGDYPTKSAAVAALPEVKAKLGGGVFVVAEP